jgi:L-alanine-DL-glutamate epimerase-like enolase superfamily enzyme
MAADATELLDPDTGELDPARVNRVMRQSENPGGHGDRPVAIGAVDVAMWDVAAKLRQQPLAQLFAERFGTGKPRDQVWVYAAGRYYSDGGSPDSPARELRTYLDQGFVHVKMKTRATCSATAACDLTGTTCRWTRHSASARRSSSPCCSMPSIVGGVVSSSSRTAVIS